MLAAQNREGGGRAAAVRSVAGGAGGGDLPAALRVPGGRRDDRPEQDGQERGAGEDGDPDAHGCGAFALSNFSLASFAIFPKSAFSPNLSVRSVYMPTAVPRYRSAVAWASTKAPKSA